MTELHPYPEYRDSDVLWLEGIPHQWGLSHGGAVLQQKQVKNRGMIENTVLSLSYGRIVVKPPEKLHGLVPESFETYQIVEPGNIIIRPTDLQNDKNTIRVGIARDRGIITSAYLCFGTRKPLMAEYAYLLLLGYDLKKIFYGIGSGLRQNLDWSDFKRLPILLPPANEQMVIVAYANQIDRRISRFIRNRRRLIGVLNEQKQAIINRAVTRGLDPNFPLKPSGIEWLGDIPRHWEVKRLKWVTRLQRGYDLPQQDRVDGRYPVVSSGGIIDTHNEARAVGPGVVMGRYGSTEAVFYIEEDFWPHNTSLFVTDFQGNSKRWCYYLLRTISKADHAGKSAVPGVDRKDLYDIYVPVPPLNEQSAIASGLYAQLASADEAIMRVNLEVNLIREYRTRLIADVVTGKVDVRHLVSDTLAKTASVAVHKPVDAERAANIHFKRSVFAAEIVHRLHDEPTFGHVKFQKLVFLCEKQCGVETGSTYHRQAAGPYDNRALRSIDSQIKKQQWYEAQKVDKRYWYVPLAKAGGHKTYFDRYFADVEDEFTKVIDMLRKADSEQSEIVATLYSAWENLLRSGEQVTEDRIIEQVLHHWHPSKQRIDEDRWRLAIGWMKKKGLVPRMTGPAEAEDLECLEADECIDDKMPEEDEAEFDEEVTDADD